MQHPINHNWDGIFSTIRLEDLAGKSLDLYSIRRQMTIENERRDFRLGIESLFRRHPASAIALLLEQTAEGQILNRNALDIQEASWRQLSELFGEIDRQRSIQSHFPIQVRVHKGNQATADFSKQGTTYGYAVHGSSLIQSDGAMNECSEGDYFALNGNIEVLGKSDDSTIVMVTRNDNVRPDTTGKAANRDRMPYLDGGQAAVLVAPENIGDPCINLLIVPPNKKQTAHFHPSDRVGVVLQGSAVCSTFENVDRLRDFGGWQEHAMQEGELFLLPAGKLHKFTTGKDPLTAFTFHPDSLTAVAKENPMLQATIRNTKDLEELYRKRQ